MISIRRVAPALAACAAAAGLAACASANSTAGVESPARGQSVPGQLQAGSSVSLDVPAQQAGAATTGSGANGASTALVVGSPPTADIERSVAAAYTVPPGAFLASFQGVLARGVGLGGYVVSSTTQPDRAGRIVSGSVTIKVPSARIADFLNAMPATFAASSINFASVDHTAAFVDVNARLASAHAHLAALDALLARATSIADITSLEQQVEVVQTEIDTDQGQLNVLTASVDLATAAVQLRERGATVVQAAVPGPVSSGVSGGWNNAVQVTGAVLDGAISALPLLVLALAALVLWRRLSHTTPASRSTTPQTPSP
jgi:hypothetical protein